MQDSYWEELLPMALECGMTPTQFWEEEPRLVNSYIRKHEMELDEFNDKSWLLNVYVFKAVSAAIGLFFADEKDKNKIKYFDNPIEEFYVSRKKNVEQNREETIKTKHRNKVNYWAKFAKKGGKNGRE